MGQRSDGNDGVPVNHQKEKNYVKNSNKGKNGGEKRKEKCRKGA